MWPLIGSPCSVNGCVAMHKLETIIGFSGLKKKRSTKYWEGKTTGSIEGGIEGCGVWAGFH